MEATLEIRTSDEELAQELANHGQPLDLGRGVTLTYESIRLRESWAYGAEQAGQFLLSLGGDIPHDVLGWLVGVAMTTLAAKARGRKAKVVIDREIVEIEDAETITRLIVEHIEREEPG